MLASLDSYLETVSPDIQELLKDFGVLDVAHKVVGVGSVGTRDYVVLLQGNHVGDELFLQVKEALPTVVRDPALPRHPPPRPPGRGRPAPHPVGQRSLPRLDQRRSPAVLRPSAAGHEGRRRSQAPPGRRAAGLRRAVRRDPGQGPRPDRLPGRHRHLLRRRATASTRRWWPSLARTPTRSSRITPRSCSAVKAGLLPAEARRLSVARRGARRCSGGAGAWRGRRRCSRPRGC